MSKDEIEPNDEPETYELAEPADEPAAAQPPQLDPRMASEDVDLPPDEEPAEKGTQAETEAGIPKILQGIPEPKFVDPEVKAIRREEQRKRAAEELAQQHAKSRKIKLVVFGVILLIVVVIGAVVAFRYL